MAFYYFPSLFCDRRHPFRFCHGTYTLNPLRKLLGLENYITIAHIENMNELVIVTSGLIGISYFTEFFAGYYVGEFEGYIIKYRLVGDYAIFFITMILCNVILPQLLWFRGLRRNILFSFILSLFVNIGMWLERFIIIVTTLSRDYLPSSWVVFFPTMCDVGMFIFSIGLFLILFLLMIRYIPIVNMSEVKELVE